MTSVSGVAPASPPHSAIEVSGGPAVTADAALPKGMQLSRGWKSAGLLLLVMAAALAAWRVHSWLRPPTVIRSLAVLPLESLSSDASQDYFADGMTDELISDLGQIGALRVISRTSVMAYKHTRKPLPQIARELNVDAVIKELYFVPAIRCASPRS